MRRAVRIGMGLAAGLVTGAALGQEVDLGTGPVLLIADRVHYDADGGVVSAEGNVEIARADRRLLADQVRYDQREDVVEALGNVIVLEPGGEALFADQATFSGDLRDGVIDQLSARLTDNSLFAAAEARRISGERIEMDRAVYSPCRVCPESRLPPLWQITARQVTHDQAERTISYRNAFFEIFGVPLAYTPFFLHPDPTVERESGFLTPSIGSDSELGFTLETPYYFALAPNYDLTLAPIVTSEEGVVLTSEWRHLTERGRYEFAGSITYGTEPEETPGDVAEGRTWRGHIEGDGRFQIDRDWGWGYDLAVASDDTYLQRYDFSNKNILENRLFAERIRGRNYAGINAYGFQGLRQRDVQGLIPIVAPLAEVDLTSDPGWRGSVFTFDGNVLALTRTEGLDTRRLSAEGGWELPWLGPIGDQYRLRLSLRGDIYHIDGDPVTLQEDGTNFETRAFPRATLDWSWPLIGDSFGLTPLIEPVVSATAAPTGLNEIDIPNEDSRDLEFDDTNLFEPDRFPGLDRVEGGTKISYGMRFGLYDDARQWASGVIGQSYRFSEDDIFGPETGLDGNFSDYVGRIDFTPDPWLGVRYRFRLDRDSLSLLRNEVQAGFGPPRVRFDVNYLSLERDPAVDEFREREEITAGVLLGVSPGLSVRAQTRRNLTAGSFVAHKFGLVYRNPCLLLIAGLERRFTENRDAGGGTTITVRVAFTHLGELRADSTMFGL